LAYPLRERVVGEEREQGNDGGEEQRGGELGCEQEGGGMQELWAEILQVILGCGIWGAIGERVLESLVNILLRNLKYLCFSLLDLDCLNMENLISII
jgi:hypothetical protein